MARTRDSPDPAHICKRPRRLPEPVPGPKIEYFTPLLFDHNSIAALSTAYAASTPFKHALVEKIFQDDLLIRVKDECISHLSFAEKETDIYKVNQTGDLASLNYLDSEQISLLPNLLTLRDALYSSQLPSPQSR
ncbi:putative component of NuA3 histone acetyltransferase complex [Leucoagaricus gongylophorus]